MSDIPERIWLDWPGAKHGEPFYTEPPERDTQAGQTEYVRADIVQALPAVQPDLTDPAVVHLNMLRGTIAKPSLKQIIHLYGVDALAPLIVQPHVNETPKSEHVPADVLTLTAERDRLRAALIAERIDTLWNAYSTGMERDGRWRHMCMSDGEWLEHECGLDDSQRDHPADVVKAAIPLAAKRFVATLVAPEE